MGNCCSAKKKTDTKASVPVPIASKPEVIQEKYLKFKSKDLNFSYKLEYHSTKSLNSYLSNLVLSHPELILEDIILSKKNQIITDFSLTLRELDILPSDELFIEENNIPKKTHSPSVSVSNEEIAEEESTTKIQLVGIQAKLNIAKVKTESTGDAATLWRSAMPSPKNYHKRPTNDPDASSLINPADLTIEEKNPINFPPYDVKNGQSVLLDSDDSCLKNDMKARDSLHRHPYDFFKDLQGPFSVLKQL
jgi:hypothetical protein